VHPFSLSKSSNYGSYPGARLGPYEIVSPLGKGGTGEVCRRFPKTPCRLTGTIDEGHFAAMYSMCASVPN